MIQQHAKLVTSDIIAAAREQNGFGLNAPPKELFDQTRKIVELVVTVRHLLDWIIPVRHRLDIISMIIF